MEFTKSILNTSKAVMNMDFSKAIATTFLLFFASASFALKTEEVEVIGLKTTSTYNSFGDEEIGHHGTSQSVNDALLLSPSVDMYENGRRSALNIRGIGYTGGPPNPGIEPTNSVYLDGIYIPRTHMVSSELVNLDSIEVYKHAISAANSSAIGNVLLETRRPSVEKSHYSVEGGIGENDRKQVGLSGNVAFSSKAAFSTYIFDTNSDGIYTNVYNDEPANYHKTQGGYIKFLWAPVDSLTIDVLHSQTNDQSDWVGSGRASSYLFTDAQRNFFNRSVPFAYLFAGANLPPTGEIFLPGAFSSDTISSDLNNKSEKLDRISGLNIDYEMDRYTLHSTTAAIHSDISIFADIDNTNFNLANQSIEEQLSWYSEDINLVYDADDFTIKNGLYIAASDSSYHTTSYAGDAVLYLRAFIAENDLQREYYLSMIEQAEGYGKAAPVNSASTEKRQQFTYYFQVDTDDTSIGTVSVGGSASKVKKEFSKSHQGLCGEDTSHLPNSECTPISSFFVDKYYFEGATSVDETGYNIFVDTKSDLTEKSTLEFNIGRTKKIGGFGQTQSIGHEEGYARSIDDLYFKPEYTNSVSLSWGLTFPSISTELTASPFFISVKDYQLSYYDGLGFYTANAEKVQSKGVELLADSMYFNHVRWITSASYSDARYIDNTFGPCPPDEYRSVQNCNYLTWEEASAANDSLRSDLSGEKLRAPSFNASSMLKLTLADFSRLASDLSVEADYTGGTRTTEFINSGFKRGGFTTYNLYFNFSHLLAGMDFEFSVRNATDKEIKVLEFPSPIIPKIARSPGGMDAFMYPRRQLAMLLRYNF